MAPSTMHVLVNSNDPHHLVFAAKVLSARIGHEASHIRVRPDESRNILRGIRRIVGGAGIACGGPFGGRHHGRRGAAHHAAFWAGHGRGLGGDCNCEVQGHTHRHKDTQDADAESNAEILSLAGPHAHRKLLGRGVGISRARRILIKAIVPTFQLIVILAAG
jgi:hypothetical protein